MCWSLLAANRTLHRFLSPYGSVDLVGLAPPMRADCVESLRARRSFATTRDGKRISAALAQLRRTMRYQTAPRSEHGERRWITGQECRRSQRGTAERSPARTPSRSAKRSGPFEARTSHTVPRRRALRGWAGE